MTEPKGQFRWEGSAARVLLVGGEDVHKRIDLMSALSDRFQFAAAGTSLDLAGDFLAAGFPFFYYPMGRGANPLSDARTFFFLGRVIKQLQPDLVHAFATKPAVWGRLAARWADVPIVMGTLPGLGSLFSFHDVRTRVVRSVYQRLQRRACYGSALTVFQNMEDLGYFVEHGLVPKERAAVIPGSGVRTDILDRSTVGPAAVRRFRDEVGAREGEVVVTMIARMIRSKGVLEFARASKLLGDLRPKVHFVLVGPEDQRSWDSLSADELAEVKGSVRWLGEREDVKTIYAGSDIFALPSYREGMPRVLLEAASMGLPLVATKTGGCEAVVDGESNGFLVDAGDAGALADRIRTLAAEPLLRKRFARQARRTATERFDLRVIAEATAVHYRRLLDAYGRPGPSRRLEDLKPKAHRKGSVSA